MRVVAKRGVARSIGSSAGRRRCTSQHAVSTPFVPLSPPHNARRIVPSRQRPLRRPSTFHSASCTGGYRLARPAETITIGDVLRSVDDGVNQLGTAPAIPIRRGTGIDRVWASVRQAVAAIVDHTTIADVIGNGADGASADRSPGLTAPTPKRALNPDSPANVGAEQNRGERDDHEHKGDGVGRVVVEAVLDQVSDT